MSAVGWRRAMAAGIPLALSCLLASCTLQGAPLPAEQQPPAHAVTPEPGSREGEYVLLAAGDIGECGYDGDKRTAALLDDMRGTVVALGDLAYDDGTHEEFAECYEPNWGRHKRRTLPVPGNHEYHTRGAEGYFDYFGASAGHPRRGYYSLTIGGWHVIALNSNCEYVGGCGLGSPQARWLKRELSASRARCTMAFWHHPRFSSGYHGSDDATHVFWQHLYNAGAELVLNGHDHNYERFGPQTPGGEPDLAHGITQIIVGTGGTYLRDVDDPIANSRAHSDGTLGVLRLTLWNDGARWRFVPVSGESFTDTGRLTCHDEPS